MRRLILIAVLGVALTLPALTPAPVSAQIYSVCPAGYPELVSLEFIQAVEPRFGKVRQAAAQDVNHNGLVCVRFTGRQGVTFADDIPLYDGQPG